MVYSFELLKHANIRYRESVSALARCELSAMLAALGISAEIQMEALGGSQFLSFESRALSESELSVLSGHSSVVFMASQSSGLLRPLKFSPCDYLPEDLPEILKYKGKTSVAFTRMMINTARAISAFSAREAPLLFLDPLCGKATGCFCALCAGMNAFGVDVNQKDLHEAEEYFARYLKYHQLKHSLQRSSRTLPRNAVPLSVFSFSDSREHYKAGDTRQLTLAVADTADCASLFRKEKAHLMAADLPYGVQHAPQSGARPEPLPRFLARVLPAWRKSLRPGGAIALSFNTLTLPSAEVREALRLAGFQVKEDEPFLNLRHEVEQAVMRDVVFALNPEEESDL